MAIELTWGRKRQIMIIGVLSLLLIGIFTLGFYLLFSKPKTCFDGIKNQGETGIDCGGDCARICRDDSRGLIVSWVRLFKIRDGLYSAAAQIENPNVGSIASNVPYTFTLKDKSGATVTTREGEVFIPSHKSFVIFEGTIQADSLPETVFFQFDESPDWQKSSYVEPELVIENKQLANEDTSPRLTATVRNPNISEVKDITLSALVYDDQGNTVQVSQTYVEEIAPGASANVTFTWPLPISLKSRICESPVDVSLVIDRSGSMTYLGENPPQPLTDVKNAASSFVKELSKFDQASVVSFANEASNPIEAFLSADLAAASKAIESIAIIPPANMQNTNIADGILKGSGELLSSRARSAAGKVLVVLTDGVATRPLKAGDPSHASKYALSVAAEAKEKGVRVFTIGLGKDLDQEFLKQVASAPSDFYLSPTTSQLSSIYREIGTKMCKRRPTTLEVIPSIPLQ